MNQTTIIYVDVSDNGEVGLEHLETILEEHHTKKCLVSLMYVNNEIGNILQQDNRKSCVDSHRFTGLALHWLEHNSLQQFSTPLHNCGGNFFLF